MSGFNGSGTFNISGVGLPYVSGTTISSSVANQLNTDLATGLSTCITKDGQSTVTANIGWNNFNINNLSALGIGTASPSGKMEVKSGSTTNFIIDSSGNVGIGTTTLTSQVSGTATVLQLKGAASGLGSFKVTDATETVKTELWSSATGAAGLSTTTAHPLLFSTSNTERMRIDSSGNVGINATSITSLASLTTLQIGTGSGGAIRFGTLAYAYANSSLAEFGTIGATDVSFFTNNASRMRIDSSGNVGIGTNSPASKLDVNNGNTSGVSATISASGVSISQVNIGIGVVTAGRPFIGTNTNSNPLEFGTRANSDLVFLTNTTERMRIDTNGYALIGYTSSNGAYKLQVNSQIFATSSTIATSDGKYKENVNTLENALDLVCALNPVSFDWKQHPVHNFDRSTTTTGFIAQEVQTALQNTAYVNAIVKTNTCVIEPEEKDENGNVTKPAVTEEFLGIAEGNLIAILTKAVQELKTELDTVKTELAALKGS